MAEWKSEWAVGAIWCITILVQELKFWNTNSHRPPRHLNRTDYIMISGVGRTSALELSNHNDHTQQSVYKL